MDRHAPSRGHAGSFSAETAPAAADLDAAEFAEYLRAERERRQVTLEQVAEETKISSRHLEALERGDVRNWPGGMYRRAMMRAYAESIGVDREFALKQFQQVFDAPPPRMEPIGPAPKPLSAPLRWRPSRRHALAAGASTLALLAVAIVWKAAGSLSVGGDGFAAPAARSVAEATPSVSNVHPSGAKAAGAAAKTTAPSVANAPRAVTTAAPQPTKASPVKPRQPEVALATTSSQETAATTGTVAPRPLATEGTLVVESDPAGARVTVNGVGWGETPITIRHLEFGSKRIRLTLQGHVSTERVVHLEPARPSGRVRLPLRSRP